MNKITNTQIEQIDTLCKITLVMMEKIPIDEYNREALMCNVEIIQNIIKKVKINDK